METFKKRGVRIVALSVDPPEVTLKHTQKQGYSFTFLCDPKGEVICRYDLMHEKRGPGAADISRPAEFLIDPQGNVRWGQSHRRLPRPPSCRRGPKGARQVGRGLIFIPPGQVRHYSGCGCRGFVDGEVPRNPKRITWMRLR